MSPLTNSFAVVVVPEGQPRPDDIESTDVEGYPIEQPFMRVQEFTEMAQALDILVSDEGDKSLDARGS